MEKALREIAKEQSRYLNAIDLDRPAWVINEFLKLTEPKEPKTEIIFECGLGHSGSLVVAMGMAKEAKGAGADWVKFQKFGSLTHHQLKEYMFPTEVWARLFGYCREIGIEPFASVFHPSDVRVMETLDVKRYKIPKGEATNSSLIVAVEATGKFYLSSLHPCSAFPIHKNAAYLHCVGEYPTGLSATLLSLVPYFDGYSSHTGQIKDSVAAVALGAKHIEVHVKPDGYEGPDSESSLTYEQFRELVKKVRAIE